LVTEILYSGCYGQRETTDSGKGTSLEPCHYRQPGDNAMRKKAKKKKAGDELRRKLRRPIPRIIKDPITGLAVLSAGKNAPKLTNEQVREMLTDFP
jgi:hypothetical protein